MQTAFKILRLLEMLSGIRTYSKNEIRQALNISERNFYRYLGTLKDFGFVVNKEEGRYIIEKNNKNIKDISSLLHFSAEESYILNEAINRIEASTKTRQNLIAKLSALYDNDRIAIRFTAKEQSSKIKPLLEAIRQKKKAVIGEYRSSESGTIVDRTVEPFDFTPNYISVWAYEAESKENKLFKVERMKQVSVTEEPWQFEAEHKSDPVDCFRIAGKKQIAVSFGMSLLARNLLTEEYPLSEQFVTRIDDNRYRFEGMVSGFQGIGRFILGLPGEIFCIDNEELKKYLNKKTKNFSF